MKGRNHLRMGACSVGCVAALGVIPWTEAPAAVAAGIGIFMFGKVAPDLDHRSSSVTRSWGPLSWLVSLLVRLFARFVYIGWRGPNDPADAAVHRGFTHTLPGAGMAGSLLGLAVLGGPVVAATSLGLALGAAARVWDRGLLLYGGVVGAALGWFAWSQLLVAMPWLVLVMTLGCFAHAVDDCVTTAGAPLRFPFMNWSTGKRWEKVGTPEWMRFNTGGHVETAVVWSAMIATTGILYFVFLAPHVGPFLLEAVR